MRSSRRKCVLVGLVVLVVPLVLLALPFKASAAGPQPTGSPTGEWYVVKTGDTLWSLSRRFGTTPWQIAADNGIANPNLIFIGQLLWIRSTIPPHTPCRVTHVVQPGEWLAKIARNYGIPLGALVHANRWLRNPNWIYPGQNLCVPYWPPPPHPL